MKIIDLFKALIALISGLFIAKTIYDKNEKIDSLQEDKKNLENEVIETKNKLNNSKIDEIKSQEELKAVKTEKEILKSEEKIKEENNIKVNKVIKKIDSKDEDLIKLDLKNQTKGNKNEKVHYTITL